jgi:hypothetical protein
MALNVWGHHPLIETQVRGIKEKGYYCNKEYGEVIW